MMSTEYIPISELARCSICPLQVYLERNQKDPFTEPLSYTIAKQLSYHLGDRLNEAEILREIELVSGSNDAGPKLHEMIIACSNHPFRPAEQFDQMVVSSELGISGKIDRIFSDGFSIIKSGKAPTQGIYTPDRIRLTAYTYCLEEAGKPGFTGSIEYLGSGTVRTMTPTLSDRRAFLHTLHVAEQIRSGKKPKEIRGTHCHHCSAKERCQICERPKTLLEQIQGGIWSSKD